MLQVINQLRLMDAAAKGCRDQPEGYVLLLLTKGICVGASSLSLQRMASKSQVETCLGVRWEPHYTFSGLEPQHSQAFQVLKDKDQRTMVFERSTNQ